MRVRVHIVTGALGAGKTTFIRSLLAGFDPFETGLLVNEAAAAGGVDQITLGQSAAGAEALFGCLCCRPSDDCVQALERLRTRAGDDASLRRIIIETSGLTDPNLLLSELVSDIRFARSFELGIVLALVDASQNLTEAGVRPDFGNQLASANAVVLSNLDRIRRPQRGQTIAACRDFLVTLNPTAAILQGDLEKDQIAAWFDQAWPRPQGGQREIGVANDPGASHRAEIALQAKAFQLPCALDIKGCNEFGMALCGFGSAVVQFKAMIPIKGQDGCCLVNICNGKLQSVEHLPGLAAPEGHFYVIAKPEPAARIRSFVKFYFDD